MREKAPTTGRLRLAPTTVRLGGELMAFGEGWLDRGVKFTIDGAPVKPRIVVGGSREEDGISSDRDGWFQVALPTAGLAIGSHEVAAITARPGVSPVTARFDVIALPLRDDGTPRLNKPLIRQQEQFDRRFGHVGHVPEGYRERAMEDIRGFREERDRTRGEGRLAGTCNWTPVGPMTVSRYFGTHLRSTGGRMTCLAIDPDGTLYAGSANGGVWKSTDSGETWRALTDFESSLSIGAIAIDPANPSRVLAATGEYNHGDLGFLSQGILRTEDGGATWTSIGASSFPNPQEGNAVSQIGFIRSPQRVLLSCYHGFYESRNGGSTWRRLKPGRCDSFVVRGGGGAFTEPLTVIAAFWGDGLYRSRYVFGWPTPAWTSWRRIESPAFPKSFGRIQLGHCRDSPRNIYAAFSDGYGLAGIARTTDGGSTWTATGVPPEASSQTTYNLVLRPHPEDPETVYYGEVRLWKSTNGGGEWSKINEGLYADQHALVFDPRDPKIVWVGNDGGVYRSPNGGDIWESRNTGLATFQYYHLSAHPEWDTVILGGTQDNGALRYHGHPAWEYAGGGDVGVTAIHSREPTHQYMGWQTIERRTHEQPSWEKKRVGLDSFPAFVLDPSNPDVSYLADKALYRSDDRLDCLPDDGLDCFMQITAFWGDTGDNEQTAATASAIAVDPRNPDIVYVGLQSGKVRRIRRNGATWDSELLPCPIAEIHRISSIAVDYEGAVWITFSFVKDREVGEHDMHHVFRYSGSEWAERTAGLSKDNPVNCIVAPDPKNPKLLLCGADVGVFRTDDGGENWTPWDEGLPNAPVTSLVPGPRGLIRAATYGRSVWERPINEVACSDVDLYLRDNVVDTGRVRPTPSGIAAPFEPDTLVWWWQSPDIKIDSPRPNFQTTTSKIDFVTFERLHHTSPVRGQVNRVYLQVHNRGPRDATKLQARVFFADMSAGAPLLPDNFWDAPFTTESMGLHWHPIGPPWTISEVSTVRPADPFIASWDWLAPADLGEHTCLLALVSCWEDPIAGDKILDIGALVPFNKHVTLKNVSVEPLTLRAAAAESRSLVIELHNPGTTPAPFDIDVRWGNMPAGAEVFVAFERVNARDVPLQLSDDDLRAQGIERRTLEEGDPLGEQAPHRSGELRTFDVERALVLRPSPNRLTTLPGISVPAVKPLAMVLHCRLPENPQAEVRFDIVQRAGQRVVGGNTIVLRQ